MTRINAGIEPRELCDQHLLAEHREIVRIPNVILSGKYNIPRDNQRATFTLGTGHVTFFYTRIGYLEKRYNRIYLECLWRDFDVSAYHKSFVEVCRDYPKLANDWGSTSAARDLIKTRILERLITMVREPKWTNRNRPSWTD